MTSKEQTLADFDKVVAESRAAIAGASDEHLMKNWALKNNGQVFFEMPRIAVLRSMVMNHTVHHRGQLSVYLRLAGAKVPSIYGPSADEGQMP
ncbi:MAG: DinB family protein [Acidobacteriota bacterium]